MDIISIFENSYISIMSYFHNTLLWDSSKHYNFSVYQMSAELFQFKLIGIFLGHFIGTYFICTYLIPSFGNSCTITVEMLPNNNSFQYSI